METNSQQKKQHPTMLLKSNGPDLSLKMAIYEQMRFKGQQVFQGKEPAGEKGQVETRSALRLASKGGQLAQRAPLQQCCCAATGGDGPVGSSVGRGCKNSSHLKTAVPTVTQITAAVKRR